RIPLDPETAYHAFEFGGQAGEFVAGNRSLSRPRRILLVHLPAAEDAAVDLLADRALLLGGAGDLGAHLGAAGGGGGARAPGCARRRGALQRVAGLCPAAAHRLAHAAGGGAQLLDHVVALFRGLLGAAGEGARLVGHDREAAPVRA